MVHVSTRTAAEEKRGYELALRITNELRREVGRKAFLAHPDRYAKITTLRVVTTLFREKHGREPTAAELRDDWPDGA